MPIKLRDRERFLLYLAIIFIAIFIAYNFFIRGNIGKSALDKLSLTEKEILLKKNLNILSRKDELKNLYSVYSGFIKETASDEKEMTQLLKDIESLASLEGLRITNLKPYTAKKEELYTSFEIELDCESDINKLMQFFSQLNNNPSLLKVKRFRLVAKENPPSILKANMAIARVVILPLTNE